MGKLQIKGDRSINLSPVEVEDELIDFFWQIKPDYTVHCWPPQADVCSVCATSHPHVDAYFPFGRNASSQRTGNRTFRAIFSCPCKNVAPSNLMSHPSSPFTFRRSPSRERSEKGWKGCSTAPEVPTDSRTDPQEGGSTRDR